MSATIIKTKVERLYAAVPDNQTIPYEQALNAAGEDKAWLKALVFGKPTTLGRKKDTFTARAQEAATMPPMLPGFTVHSAKEVRFTLKVTGDRALASDITGITVDAPVLGSFPLKNAAIRIDAKEQILLSTKKFLVTMTIVLDKSGKYLTWRLGE